MDKIAALWFCIGAASLGLIFQGELGYVLNNYSAFDNAEKPQIAEAVYSIPPTPAWQNIGIANNQTISNNPDSFIHANNSSDTFYFVSDGSILINITEYSP